MKHLITLFSILCLITISLTHAQIQQTTMIKERIIGDREVILGLDYLYRNSMKMHERKTLLPCADTLVKKLSIPIEDVPIEGYYSETPELTYYFKLIKSLQNVNIVRRSEISDMKEYQKLLEVFGSPIYGESNFENSIFPHAVDPISTSLKKFSPAWWKAVSIINEAYENIKDSNNFSLTGIGILTKDPVVITALRESAVLFLSVERASPETPKYQYIWSVSSNIENLINMFIYEFNKFIPYKILYANKNNSEYFYNAYEENRLIGRCVCIGKDNSLNKYYHWAINKKDSSDELNFVEFWDDKIWTTEQYRLNIYRSE